MYKITQKQKQSNNWFGLKRADKVTVNEFTTYNKALIFALNEQIQFFYCHIDKIKTVRKTYSRYLTCIQFCKKAAKNPLHYTGTSTTKNLDLKNLYYYYVNSNNLHRIEKFVIDLPEPKKRTQ